LTPQQRSLRDALAAAPERVRAAASGTTPEHAPRPGEWSASDIVRHLAAVDEEVWHVRLDALSSEAEPFWPWTEPGLWSGPRDDTFEGALTAFAERRAATIARLDALDDAGWTRTGRHATYGLLDVAKMLRIVLDHDAEHIRQILG
jgi:hypothetical protein